MKYIVITTARNEEKTISKVVKSIQNQSISPQIHVIADDGSTDRTKEISESLGAYVYETNNPRMPHKGHNQALGFIGAMKYATLKVPDWQFVLKLDADSVVPSDYVEYITSKFKDVPNLGVAAGVPWGESMRQSRVTDGARIISRKCYHAIGGYHVLMAFDSHALLLARQYGFKTRTFSEKKYWELRPSKRYKIRAWIHLGLERKQMHLPFYHTFLASAKNAVSGGPPILNFFFTVFSYLLFQPRVYAPRLDKEWVSRYAIYEVKEFLRKQV